MANPTPGDVHVDSALTNVSVAYVQDASMFVADKVFPIVPVRHLSNKYFTYPRGYTFRNEMKKRAIGAPSAGMEHTITTASYSCDRWSLHEDIDEDTRSNADSAIDLGMDATTNLSQQLMINREVEWVSNFFGTSKWTTDITGVNSSPTSGQVLQWDDDNSTPIEDIRTGVTTVHESTGFRPNTLVLGQAVYDKLCDHPDIVDRVKYGQTPGRPATLDTSDLQAVFKIPRVLVTGAVQNTAAEGATDAFSFIGGKAALLVYSEMSPGLRKPTGGYTFVWSGRPGAVGGQRIKRWFMDETDCERVEIDAWYDQKLVAADLGYFFTTIIP